MRVRKNPLGTVTVDFTGEGSRLGLIKEPGFSLVIELYDGLAEELLAALGALLEKKL